MAGRANAILAINSTDRYITSIGGNVNQPISNALEVQFNNAGPYANDFSITAPGALMNGYIEKIIISQIQLQYNLPTVIPDRNDLLVIGFETGQQTGIYSIQPVRIPYGFYTPQELAGILSAKLNEVIPTLSPWSVNYSNIGVDLGFNIVSTNEEGLRFFLPTPTELRFPFAFTLPESDITTYLKTAKLYGFTAGNSAPSFIGQVSWNAPDFLYTPFIDIYSDALTNYQKLKDTDTSTIRRKGLLSRIYLSGVGGPQITSGAFQNQDGLNITPSTALGCNPFTLTYDLNNPKIINWTPDTAVNSLDFQVRDCYGDLLFTIQPGGVGQAIEAFNTEFQMTLLCIEKK